MSANTVTDAASAVSATSTASLAATITITAASIRAAASIAEHPIAAMVEARLSVSCSTDNRLMSATTLCAELQALHEQAGLPVKVLAEMQAAGMRASFLPAPVREAALARLHDWQAANGL